LALAQAAAEEVVDAVAARGEEVQTAELRLDPGAVENLEREGGREGGSGGRDDERGRQVAFLSVERLI
jgi:hypothetical protein